MSFWLFRPHSHNASIRSLKAGLHFKDSEIRKAFPSDKDKDEIFKPFFLQENDSSVDEWIEEGHYSKNHPDSNKNRLQHTGCRTKQRKTRALLKTQSHQVSFRIYVD